ncbi:MAG: hypothetical protein ABJM06_07215 [Gilvibacter sp.]
MFTKRFISSVLIVYVSSWVISLAYFLLQTIGRQITTSEMLGFYGRFMTSKQGIIVQHIFFILLLLLFFMVRYFIKVYKHKGAKVFFKRLLLRLVLPVATIVFTLTGIVSYNSSEVYDYKWNSAIENKTPKAVSHFAQDQKHRGMTVYRIGRNKNFPLDSLVSSNVEWIAILPYFYQENESSDSIQRRTSLTTWSRSDSSFIEGIRRIKDKGFKVFLKPHLWLGEGWRSNIQFNDKAKWDTWFASYRKTMLHYARMAAETDSEMLCIGTELRTAVQQKPEAWHALIAEVRAIYNGQLTYAANWDEELDAVTFWDQLDYIGVQAYFPLTANGHPNLEQIKTGWLPHKQRLEALARKHNKQVLFTEVGYKKEADATVRPWEWGSMFSRLFVAKSDKTQVLAYEALYSELWYQDWFAGSYIWQWVDSSDFAVKGSPAQNKIAEWYFKIVLEPAPTTTNSALR